MRHMLDHAREAVEPCWSRTRAHLDSDRTFNLALVRLVEIVGEAACRVSAEGLRRVPGIPWTQVKGMRNRLIHGYDEVDFDILWDTIQMDLPPLIANLEAVLGSR